jgi:hypothetical protein
MNGNQSEVANLMAAIDAQNEAAWNALYGYAEGTVKHHIISDKYEQIWRIKDQLAEHVGEEQAVKMVIERLNAEEGK